MFKTKYLLYLLIIISVFGCSINSQLTSNLSRYEQSLNYVYDSDIITEKKNVAVIVDSVLMYDSAMINSTTVTKQSGIVIPLLILNFWNYKYSCDLGENVITEDLSNFFLESIKQESFRSGIFLLNPNDSTLCKIDQIYNLDVIVDSLNIEGPYTYGGHTLVTPYGYSYSLSEFAGPAKAECKLQFILKKGKKVQLTKDIYISQMTDFLRNKRSTSSTELQEKYAIAMIEALSTAIKNSISKMITDINNFINNNEINLVTIEEISIKELQEKENIELSANEIESKRKLLPGFFNFHIDDGRIIEGRLRKVKKNEICVEDGRTLITIKRKKLEMIKNSNQEDVTEKELLRKDFSRINYNYYLEYIEIN